MADRRARRPRAGDRLGPGDRRLRGRHLRRLDDRLALRRRDPALVHGRPLGGRDLRRGHRRPGAPRGRRRPLRWRPVSPRAGAAAAGPGLLVACGPHPGPATPLHAGLGVRRLGAAGRRLDRAAQGHRPPRDPRRVDRSIPATGSSPATTPPAAGSRSVATGHRTPTSPTRSRPRARSRASTTRSRSAAAVTSTAACTRPRTSICSATRDSTWSSASTRPRRFIRPAPGIRASVWRGSSATPRAGVWAPRRASFALAGTDLVLVQPTGEDLAVMGPNLMSRRDRNAVIETARHTVAAQLRRPENRDLLADLPAGDERRIRPARRALVAMAGPGRDPRSRSPALRRRDDLGAAHTANRECYGRRGRHRGRDGARHTAIVAGPSGRGGRARPCRAAGAVDGARQLGRGADHSRQEEEVRPRHLLLGGADLDQAPDHAGLRRPQLQFPRGVRHLLDGSLRPPGGGPARAQGTLPLRSLHVAERLLGRRADRRPERHRHPPQGQVEEPLPHPRARATCASARTR